MCLKSLINLFCLIFFLTIGNSYAQNSHNSEQESEVIPGHFRRQGSAQFENLTVDREALRKKVDVAKIESMLEAKRQANKKAYEAFLNIPDLPECSDNKTKIDKSKFVPSPSNKFQIDMLLYDPSNSKDRAASQIWPGRKIAYDPAEPDHIMRFGLYLGLSCLPTRIISTDRGLELRTGDLAWKLSKKEKATNDKSLGKEIKLLRGNSRKKR